jgi:hypothetical protein
LLLDEHRSVNAVAAEDDKGFNLTATVTPLRGGAVGGPFPMYHRGKPMPLTLACDMPVAGPAKASDMQGWTIVARNDDPEGGPLFVTSTVINITRQQELKIVVTPGQIIHV